MSIRLPQLPHKHGSSQEVNLLMKAQTMSCASTDVDQKRATYGSGASTDTRLDSSQHSSQVVRVTCGQLASLAQTKTCHRSSYMHQKGHIGGWLPPTVIVPSSRRPMHVVQHSACKFTAFLSRWQKFSQQISLILMCIHIRSAPFSSRYSFANKVICDALVLLLQC